ncbi:MAG TPA: helix-turn-helix domain-containing protein [Solirubrobacterales bacterium]|nr:helix-turn-helix domain-containing protein [Solirubrobacterales bacterium]
MKERESNGYRRALAEQLREESGELEDYVFDRIRAREEGPEPESRGSFEGLRRLIAPLIEYACVAIEAGAERCPPPPAAVIEHARVAAWSPMPTRILQERYLIASTAFKRYLRCEVVHPEGHTEAALAQVIESTEIVFERLFATVGEEHEKELQKKGRSREARRLETVEALLAGELLEAPGLDYDFEATHVGIVAIGADAGAHIKRVARAIGQLLVVQAGPQKVWAWIGTQRDVSAAEVEERLRADCPASARVSLGEAASGLAGWNRTHREAAEALAVARRQNQTVVRYGEVQIFAAMLGNELMQRSIEEHYLLPLANGKSRGVEPLASLRAYFAADRNGKAASFKLGVSPQTVTNHLQRVEECIGRPVASCGMELEAALLLADAPPDPEQA